MAKAIKRVGVIFFAVAIICLMAIGVILGISDAKGVTKNLLGSSNKIENVQTTAAKNYTLSGTNSQMATTWNEAVKYSVENNVNVKVVLGANWTAQSDATLTTTFGSGDGFRDGRILVPADCNITLDLNGKTINRALSTAIPYGECIFIDGGVMNLVDTKYNSALVASLDTVEKINNAAIGKITGGKTGVEINKNGSAISIYNNAVLNMYGGVIYNNKHNSHAGHSGAVGMGGYATFNMYGGLITHNESATAFSAIVGQTGSTMNLYAGIVRNNKTNIVAHATHRCGAVGMYARDVDAPLSKINLGAGIQIYDNFVNTNDVSNTRETNLALTDVDSDGKIIHLLEPMVKDGVGATYVGITNFRTDKLFIDNYAEMANGSYANRFFFSDDKTLKVDASTTQAKLVTGAERTTKVTWSWSGAGSGSTTNPSYAVPYTGGAYTIRCADGSAFYHENTMHTTFSATKEGHYVFIVNNGTNKLNQVFTFTIGEPDKIKKPSGTLASKEYTGEEITCDNPNSFDSNKMVITDNKKTNAGKYTAIVSVKNPRSYWSDGDCMPIEFAWEITKKPVVRPTKSESNVFVYEKDTKHAYLPTGYNSTSMKITYSEQTKLGTHTAKVVPDSNHKWSSGTDNEELSFSFEIIHPGVVLKDNSNFDYIYKDSNNLRQSYKDNKIIHKVSESETTSNYVIGNIAPKTTLKQFVGDIRKECGYIKIYNENTLLYDGTTEAEACESVYVATGYRLELYKNSNGTELLDTVYLSVLGDVVANGVIDTADVTFISRIVNEEIKLETLSIEQQLAAMVDNKGKVTSTDGKILLNVIGGNTEVDDYFENVSQEDKYQILVLNSISGKTYRQNMNLTTLNVYDNAIIGNISPQTKVNEFKTKLATQTSANISDITIHKANGAIAGDNDYIGTGYYINYNGKTIYLSVLGDLTGDGEVNTMDVTCLNRIISGNVKLNTNEIKDKLIMLSAIIQNKGNLTTADSETLLNYIGGNADMTKYF